MADSLVPQLNVFLGLETFGMLGKLVPPDGNWTSLEKETGPDGSGRNSTVFDVNRK